MFGRLFWSGRLWLFSASLFAALRLSFLLHGSYFGLQFAFALFLVSLCYIRRHSRGEWSERLVLRIMTCRRSGSRWGLRRSCGIRWVSRCCRIGCRWWCRSGRLSGWRSSLFWLLRFFAPCSAGCYLELNRIFRRKPAFDGKYLVQHRRVAVETAIRREEDSCAQLTSPQNNASRSSSMSVKTK